MTLTSDVFRYLPCVYGERKPVTFTGETPGNWIRSSAMMSFMMWLMFQVMTTAMFMAWYAKKHPSDAMQMFMKWRSMFSKS